MALAQMDAKESGQMGLATVLYYLTTTVLATLDGNALYEAVAVIFIAQLNNVDLSFAEVVTDYSTVILLLYSVTATVASIGLGSVPAGLVSILLILNTVGLPVKDVSLLLTVDWLLDRVRTSINVLGDGFAAGVVAHILQKRLDVSDARNDFRTEIKEEIELLRSAANSRRPSFTWSEHSKESSFIRLLRGDVCYRKALGGLGTSSRH
ncbi:hypothetical protein ANCDUO_13919 [Ancylostoma duodenale]|uniref:Amino acid transporter n=1 Tax=Ancylostoma duodenale TaxID=51022 RepID=A0A0C2D1M7_9BILA|nr:hypothetical protein ANCDUO_13919 [Ancylostoma duodenale]